MQPGVRGLVGGNMSDKKSRKGATMSPRLIAAAREAGMAALVSGDFDQAVDQLGRAHDGSPDPEVRRLLADASFRLGMRELASGTVGRAHEELSRAFALYPGPLVSAAL